MLDASDGMTSSARRIAVSSATLLVDVPRNSNPSWMPPPGRMTTIPDPAGPGLPEHAPSVKATHPSAVRVGLAPGDRSSRSGAGALAPFEEEPRRGSAVAAPSAGGSAAG